MSCIADRVHNIPNDNGEVTVINLKTLKIVREHDEIHRRDVYY